MNYKDRVLLEVHNVLDTWPLEPSSVNQIICSPPYFRARDYGHDDQIGGESLHDCLAWARGEEPVRGCCFICHTRIYAKQAHRVLHNSGTMTINIGDTYAGSMKGSTKGQQKKNKGSITPHLKTGTPGNLKRKDKAGVPYRIALALQADGWYLRDDIPWIKTSGMPSNYRDRALLTHEQILVFSKRPNYFWNPFATLVPSRASSDLNPAYYGLGIENADLASADNTFRRTTDWVEEWLQEQLAYHTDMAKHIIDLIENDGHLADLEGNLLFIRTPNGGNKADHFAGFHPEMIRPIIRAGTSSHGVCANCLSPYKPEAQKVVIGRSQKGPKNPSWTGSKFNNVNNTLSEIKLWQITGWSRTCKCDCDEVKRPVVLDPFLGSGTTMRVALEEKCDFIGFDVNPEYIVHCQRWLDSLELAPVIVDKNEYDFGLFKRRT